MPKHNGARPSSDELVDLHISVVPPEYWMERLNYASQKVIGDTFSAGFIRVHPGKTIAQLRKDITEQIGTEFFPENYVFLKHVGRCLALVREKQEFHLKVKNFVPPQSSLPEMFVLPARPTMYSHSVLPPIRPNMVDVARMTQDGQLRNGSPFESSQKNSALSSHSSHFEGSFLPNSTPGRSHDLPTNTPKPETAGSPDELKRLVTGNSTTGHRDSARNRPIVTQLHQEARPNKELPPVSPKKVPITQVGQKRKSTPLETEGASATHDAKKTPRVKSVLHEGPQTQKVRYNIPSHGNSDSDYAEFNAGSGHNEVDMKDDTPTKLTHHPNPPISNPDSTTFAEENPLKTIDTRNPDDDQNMDSPFSTEYTEKMDENSPDIVDEIIDTSPEYEPRLYDGTNPTYPPDPSFLPPQPQPLPNAPMNTPDTVRTLSQSKQKTTSAASKNTSQGSGVPVKSSSNNDSGFTDHDDQYGEKHGFMDGSENGIHFPTNMDHARSDNGGREEAHSVWSKTSSNSSMMESPGSFHENVGSLKPTAPPPSLVTDSDGGLPPYKMNPGVNTEEYSPHDQLQEGNPYHPMHTMHAGPTKGQIASSGNSSHEGMIVDSCFEEEMDFSTNTDLFGRNYNGSQQSQEQEDHWQTEAKGSVLVNGMQEDRAQMQDSHRQDKERSGESRTPNSPGCLQQKPLPLIANANHREYSDHEYEPGNDDMYPVSSERFGRRQNHDPGNPAKDGYKSNVFITESNTSFNPSDSDSENEKQYVYKHMNDKEQSKVRSGSERNLGITYPDVSDRDVPDSANSTDPALPYRGNPDGKPILGAKVVSRHREGSFVGRQNSETPSEGMDEQTENFKHSVALRNGNDSSDRGFHDDHDQIRALPIKNEPRSKISTFSKLPAETEHSASERIASLKKNMAINGKIVGEDHSDLSQKARLWHELQQARERRRAHEKERQDLVKKAKSMAMQINQQRNSATTKERRKPTAKARKADIHKGSGEKCPVPSCYYVFWTMPDKKRHFSLVHRTMLLVRDIWKRRYFEEKKKTSTLTELCLKLNSRLNGMQKKIVSSYELFKSSENRPPVFAGIRDRPSNKTNSKIAATKLQHSIDDLKRKLNDAKVKLTGEVKLRHQAEQDLKLMRHELLTKKIQSHAAYRKISRSRVFLRSSRLLTAQR